MASALLLVLDVPALGLWAVFSASIVVVSARCGAAAGVYGALVSMALLDAGLAARSKDLSGGMNVAAMVAMVAMALFVGSAPPRSRGLTESERTSRARGRSRPLPGVELHPGA